ncbi:MAG: hypothetical protein M3340_00125 [Actinomycetota bacterium]|nr:hypothetical protein [Actinomycetota bacterium]
MASGRTLAALLAAALFSLGVAAVPANAHYADFTGGTTQDCYIAGGGWYRYLERNGGCTGGFLVHSYSFVSANDISYDSATVCPFIQRGDGHSQWECGVDFERYCWDAYAHDPNGNDLDCHDRDGNSWYGGSLNQSGYGAWVRIHGTY